jgi:translation initiation factor 1
VHVPNGGHRVSLSVRRNRLLEMPGQSWHPTGQFLVWGQSMKDSRLVYRSASGRLCPTCGYPANDCRCSKNRLDRVLGDGRVRVERQTKGRKGKGVSLVTGLPLSGNDLKALATELKRACGVGGTVKDGTIEIQGDHREKLVEELKRRGYDAKKSGG